MPKISVIIPMYDTEEFVEKCVRSVMAQTLKDIEIICVDDCSPDDCAVIVESLARHDSRIRLIRHEHNLGLGGARNTGIRAARAPYLASVDSDDYILPEMLERLWDATGDQVADVTACGMALMNPDGSLISNISRPQQSYCNQDDQLDIFDILSPCFWNKLWRTRLFTSNGIEFPEHLYHEDLATTPRVLRHAKDIRIISDPLYCYVQRTGSITKTVSARHIIDYFRTYDVLSNFLQTENLSERYGEEFIAKIGKSLHYHTQGLSDSSLGQAEKLQYMRYMLMLKLSYLEYDEKLREMDTATLQSLLLSATSRHDIENPRSVQPVSDLKNKINESTNVITRLNRSLDTVRLDLDKCQGTLKETKIQLAKSKENHKNIQRQLSAVYASNSWRITAPLRRILGRLSK